MVIGRFRPAGVILGVDLKPGQSPVATDNPEYSAVLLVNGSVRRRYESVRLNELLRLIEELNVEVVATDNIFELGSDKESLFRMFKSLARPPKLVQVTLINGRYYSLETIAGSFGIKSGKLSPLDAAEAAARLAYLGVGSEAVLFEDETRIVISRGRSLTQGGMSKERYRRNIGLLILRATKEVKERLERNNIDYDLFVKKAEYGLESSLFIVYAPRHRLYGVVHPRRGHDYQIEIEPVTKSEIEYVPLAGPRGRRYTPSRYLILGIDPGISTGVAILSLDGIPLLVVSRRWLSRGQIIKMASEYGKVLVVATDVASPSAFAKKLASTVNAVLFRPSHNLSVEEKRETVGAYLQRRGLSIKIRDSHQRDALAAAIKAYQFYEPKMRQVEARLRELGLKVASEEVKAMVIRGLTIDEAVKRVLKRYIAVAEVAPEPPEGADPAKVVEYYRRRVRDLESQVVRLSMLYEDLLEKNKALLKELEGKDSQLERLLTLQGLEARRSKLVASLQSRVEALERELAALRGEVERYEGEARTWREIALGLAENRLRWGYVVKNLTPSNVKALLGTNLRHLPIYVLEPNPVSAESLELLSKAGVQAIVVDRDAEALRELAEGRGIPVLRLERDTRCILKGGLFFIDCEKYERLLREEERRMEEERRTLRMVGAIIKEYRERRRRELLEMMRSE